MSGRVHKRNEPRGTRAPVDLTPKFREDQVGIVTSFIRHHLEDTGRKGIVLGMSGGLDSSLVAKLCALAVGPKKVLGLSLPERSSPESERRDGREWARELGIGFDEVFIDPFVREFARDLRVTARDRVLLGNIKARVRMVILYHRAGREHRIVMGTGNKSEALCGYFSKFGDGGVDFLPIGDLYKTQVRAMAAHLGVPRRILQKTPTAGLWPGQTDEAELGLPYEDLDRVLHGIELHLSPGQIAERAGLAVKEVDRVEALVRGNVHKRKTPLIPKVGARTIGLDWRE